MSTDRDDFSSNLSDKEIEAMHVAARAAAANAYAPYSRFPVGAAVLDATGAAHSGCNVENASYGLTLCAERSAIAAAVRAGVREIKALAIFTPTETLTTPCGACRQVLAEFSKDGAMEIHAFNGNAHAAWRLADLLPESFKL